MSLSFPPFTRWVKRIIIICSVVYFLQVVFARVAPQIEGAIEVYLGLVPAAVVHYGMLWQLVTYSFLHSTHTLMHLLLNMLSALDVWFPGRADWGSRKFLEFYFFCVIGAALITVIVAYSPLPGVSPLSTDNWSFGGNLRTADRLRDALRRAGSFYVSVSVLYQGQIPGGHHLLRSW